MTNGTSCPDLELLSQFLDRELEASEESKITHHLATCAQCCAQLNDFQQVQGTTRAQLPIFNEHFALPASSLHCPSAETVTAYMQGLLAANEAQQIERHLQACDSCLYEAKEASRLLVFLASPQEGPVPALLKAQVARAWDKASSEDPSPALPRLVIQLTEWGLRLIETYLAPPLLTIEEGQSAYRSSALSLRLNAGDTEIDVLAVPEEDGVAVTLTLTGPEQAALADRRVFLRQDGRAIFSAQTNHQGELRLPALEPGSYEVSCHEVLTTFELELRL
jgi:anti-sigma factor RsiW